LNEILKSREIMEFCQLRVSEIGNGLIAYSARGSKGVLFPKIETNRILSSSARVLYDSKFDFFGSGVQFNKKIAPQFDF
jgi:hypothetical protein